MIFKPVDSPADIMDNADIRAYRQHDAHMAKRVLYDAYRPQAACKKHHSEWDDEVQTHTHRDFDQSKRYGPRMIDRCICIPVQWIIA